MFRCFKYPKSIWIYFIQGIGLYSSSKNVLKACCLFFFNFMENDRLATENIYSSDLSDKFYGFS